jgi:hypothetical protein
MNPDASGKVRAPVHGPPLILAPELTFPELSRALEALGWERDSTRPFTPDLIAGEPELAGFRARGGVGHLTYTLNPIVRLRVLDPRDLRPDERRELEQRLPLVGKKEARAFLADARAEVALLGLLVAEHSSDPALLEPVKRLVSHPTPSVAATAERVRRRLEELDRARRDTLELLAFITQAARPVLAALPGPLGREMIAELRPRPEDYARVFVEDAALHARAHYDELWRETPVISPPSDATELDVHAAPAGMLRTENELSLHFPMGYRAVADELVSERVWLSWRYRKPGASAGLLFDGLVWLDQRWAWFPKAFRALARGR